MFLQSSGLLQLIARGQPRAARWYSRCGFSEFVSGEYHVVDHAFPLIRPYPLPAVGDAGWVAPFAAKSAVAAKAEIIFVPVLQCLGGNVTTVPNLLSAGELTGYKALVVSGDQPREEVVFSNTGETIIFESRIPAKKGDWVIVAPARQFAMLPLLKIERNKQKAVEWRNWTFDGVNSIYSYTGNPLGDITTVYDDFQRLDFAPYVSPLATGVIGTLQSFSSDSAPASTGLYVSRDNSNHVIASVVTARSHLSGDGTTAPFRAAFGPNQTLWGAVSRANAIGRIVITGWTE